MKKYLPTMVLLFYIQFPAHAESDVKFSFDIFTGYNTGHTTYVMDFKNSLKSELIFPLDTFILGGTAGLNIPSPGRHHEWGISIYASANLSNPHKPMIDTDWIKIYAGIPSVVFSYTESPVELSMINLGLKAEKLLFSGNFMTGYLLAGYEYQNIKQDITGFKGWQFYLEDLSAPVIYPLDSDVPALYYEITYHKPGAGIMLLFEPHHNIDISFSAMAMAVYLKDYDDHILRNKLSTASGWGGGGKGGFDFTYRFSGMEKFIPHFGFSAGTEYIRAFTLQKQEWYDDDPFYAEAPKGTVYTGIPHLVTSFQGYIILKAGVSF